MFNASISQHIKDFIVPRHCKVFYILEEFFSPLSMFPPSSHYSLPTKKVSLGEKSAHLINAISESEVYSLLLKRWNYMENYARCA